jgi:hypothetical protein
VLAGGKLGSLDAAMEPGLLRVAALVLFDGFNSLFSGTHAHCCSVCSEKLYIARDRIRIKDV